MARLHQAFRALHWLALFQLLGGPLVLGALVLVFRTPADQPRDFASLPHRIKGAIERMQRLEAGLPSTDLAVAGQTGGRVATGQPPLPRVF